MRTLKLAELQRGCAPFRPLGARSGIQPIERTNSRCIRTADPTRVADHASFIGTGAVLTFPSTKIAWHHSAYTASIAMEPDQSGHPHAALADVGAETGSITETARRLGRTQPAVTLATAA